MSGSTNPSPPPERPVMALCNAVISPIDFNPVTNTVPATRRATIGIEPPIPLKNASVSLRVSPALRFLMISQMIATINENNVATSTLISICAPVIFCTANEPISKIIGSNGKIAYTVLYNAPPLISSTSLLSTALASITPAFLSHFFCQKKWIAAMISSVGIDTIA